MADDRRQYRRIDIDFRAELIVEREPPIRVAAELVDCSTGGLYMGYDGDLRAGERVRVIVTDGRAVGGHRDLGTADILRVETVSRAGSLFSSKAALKFANPDEEAVRWVFHAAQLQQSIRRRKATDGRREGRKMWM